MKRLLRFWWVLAVLAVGVAAWLILRPAGPLPVSPGQDETAAAALKDPALIKRGEYLATVGDCAACHTARDGRPYAGGRSLATPFGDVPAPNITPDSATGIGAWSFADFWRALHDGKGRQGPDGLNSTRHRRTPTRCWSRHALGFGTRDTRAA